MAFLPQPCRPSGESIMKGIPWTLPSGVYLSPLDGSSYETYPEDCGWHPRSATRWVTLFKERNTDFERFLQTWLLSGLLSFMFQEPVDLAGLISDDHEALAQNLIPADLVLTREWLGPLVERLQKLPVSHEDISKRRRCWWKIKRAHDRLDSYDHDGLTQVIEEDDDFEYSLEGFGKTFASGDPRSAWDNMLLRILIVFFESVLWGKRAEKPEETPEQGFSYLQKLKPAATNTWSFDFLSRCGLCPTTGFRLYTRLEAPALWYYLNCRGRPYEGNEHRECTLQRCKLLNVELGRYERRHFLQGCKTSCEDIEAPQTSLLDILCQDQLPLVDLNMDNDDPGLVYISSPCNNPVPYVAISHVWSDGLGHDSNNALLDCQFLYISEKIRGLSDKGITVDAFWMDTLCVPRKSSAYPDTDQYTEAKKKGITLIRTSFLEAVAVLVLDAWLMSTSLRGLSDAEILIRILNSPWNARLWTFQEGATAQKLFFQFADGVYDLDDGMTRFRALDDIFVAHTLKPSVDRLYTQLRGFYFDGCCTTHKLREVVTAVRLRASTLAADEPLCLAALLKLDLSRMASVKDEDRIVEFWAMIKIITFDMYCINAPRIQRPGFRWAPQSLLLHHDKTPNFPPVPDIQEPLARSQHFGTINYHGFHMALMNGELGVQMMAFDLGNDPVQPLEHVMLRLEMKLAGHPYMTSTQMSPGVIANPLIDVRQHYGTDHVVLFLISDEREFGFRFGTYEEHFEGVGRDGFLAAIRTDVDNTFIHCGEIRHRAELPCEKCDAKAAATEQKQVTDISSHKSDESTLNSIATNALQGDCGEKRSHEHWKETIYICPARLTLLPDVETPERQRLQQFRDDFDRLRRTPLDDSVSLNVPGNVTFGKWRKELWRVT